MSSNPGRPPPPNRSSSSFRLASLASFAGKLVGTGSGSSSNSSLPSTSTSAPPPDTSRPSTPSAPPSAWSRSSSFSSLRHTSSSSLTPLTDSVPIPQVHPPTTPTTPTANTSSNNHNGSTSTGIPISRTISEPQSSRKDKDKEKDSSSRGSFGRSALSNMMGNLSSISLRTSDKDKDKDERRGRSRSQSRPSAVTAAADSNNGRDTERSHSRSRARSTSPFFRRRTRRERDPSPSVEALANSDWESDTDSLASSKRGPRHSAFSIGGGDDSASEAGDDDDVTDIISESSWSEDEEMDKFDDLTELNTERNAQTVPPFGPGVDEPEIDPTGEGINVVVPPEPLFPTTLHGYHGPRRQTTISSATTRRRNTMKVEPHLPLETSRPIFQRDRCTIRLVNGTPVKVLEETGRRPRRYVVASDLSIESKYAVEWCIGTVMRDGDEMIVVTVTEGDGKLDPPEGSTIDRVVKLRNQQERQTLAYLLVRQVTSLLQRTRLNVTVVCQAWHAKNSRHRLLDLIDYIEPTMLIVGSRGLGKLKGILLGSTSHYLIQKSSVPVMVARRRLKRPPRKSAHLSSHRARVPLSEAAIDKAPSKVENDVEAMRDEILKGEEEATRRGAIVGEVEEREEGEVDPEAEGGQR